VSYRKSILTILSVPAAVISLTVGSTSARAQFVGPTPLTLINGWTNSSLSTSDASVEEVSGIVQFRGAISTHDTNAEPFVLSSSLRPITDVYIPVDLCNATKGRLWIQPSGIVTVQAETSFSNAQCLTSLDGASFARVTTGFAPLTLINGWVNAPFGTSDAAVRNMSGIIHFKGAIFTTGSNPEPFVLPPSLSPANDVYIPIDLCNATNGRLWIQPSGVVTVQAQTSFGEAQCLTSLDGAWFVLNDLGFAKLTLTNGWTNAPNGTNVAKAGNAYGVVYLQGAIATGGTDPVPLTLPVSARPVTPVYIHIDLCNATNGQLLIQPTGMVTVEAETAFSDAQCFTSLDGASFVQ
jgi:hypothetical protein